MNNFGSPARRATISAAAAPASARAAAIAGRRQLLGITGPPGAGKSSIAEAVVSAVPDAVLVPMDGFHLAQKVLDNNGLAGRKGAPETFDRAGYAALLRRIRDQQPGDEPVYAPAFRRDIEEPIASAIAVHPSAPLVVTEGNYLLLWPEISALLDEAWWVDLPDEVRRRRLVARHAEFGKSRVDAERWALGSDEANARLVAPGREKADVIVRGD